MNILWWGRRVLVRDPRGLSISKQLKASFDVRVSGIKLCGSLIRIKSIVDLVVARFIQCTQIVPDLRNIWVQADSPTVCIQCIAVLINLVVENTDRAPESGITPISVNSLLIRLVSLRILLL